MEPSLIVAIIGLIATPLAVTITFILNRKKYGAEVIAQSHVAEKTNIESLQLIIDELREYVLEVEVKLDLANKKIDLLLHENVELHEKLSKFIHENNDLHAAIGELQKKHQAPPPT